MKQTTKFLCILMCMVLGLSLSFQSCKDYDDDIDSLNNRVDKVISDLSTLQTTVNGLVKSVTYNSETGVLTVTPVNGEAINYTLGQKIPEYELKVDGTSCWLVKDGVQVGDKLEITLPVIPEIPEYEEFNPALLTVAVVDGQYVVSYNKVPTNVTIPVPAGNSIVKDGNTVTITMGDETVTFTLFAGNTLTSLVFIPEAYYQGIEAMLAKTYEYEALTLATVDANGNYPTDAPVTGEAASVTPGLVAQYHLNPSNVNPDLLVKENLSYIAEDKSYTRAAVTPSIDAASVKDNILTVTSTLSGGTIKDIENDDQVTVLALQVAMKGVEDTVITSDYAAVKKAVINNIVLSEVVGKASEVNCDNSKHLYTTAAAAIAADPQFDIVWNDEDGMDIAELIQAHYDVVGEVPVHTIWDNNANAGTVENYGFKYTYELVGYTSGDNQTSQSAHAALKGSILRAQMTKDGKQQAFGAEQSRATIGRMPLVRVVLKDTVNDNNVAVGYIKFEITSTAQENEITVIDPFVFTEGYTVSCSTDAIEHEISWAQAEEQIIAVLGLSKDEFETQFVLDGFAANTTPATQYDNTTANAQEVVAAFGEVNKTTSDTEGQMTEVLQWTITADEAYEYFVNPKNTSKSVIVRFTKNNGGTFHYVYVTFTWTPSPLNVTPAGEVDDESKFAEYWFDTNSNVGGSGYDEVHANVKVPNTGETSADCTFEKDLHEFFANNKVVIKMDEPAIYTDYTDDKLEKTFKFTEPTVKEAKGVSGKTYVLGVSADGLSFLAEVKVNESTVVSELSEKVAVIDANGKVTYQENDVAKDLLNYADHIDLANTLTARVVIEAENGCDKGLSELRNDEFDVKFLRPISIVAKDNEGLTDGLDNGDEIALVDIMSFTDWREKAFTEENDYFNYYGITAVSIDPDMTTTNANNSDITKDLLKDVAPQINLTFTAAGTLSLTDMGKLNYKNNGGVLGADFQIRVYVTVEYKWGKVVVPVDITVHKTTAQG